MISSRVHGYIDYIIGFALLAAPFLFGFADEGGMAVLSAWLVGFLIIGQSLITRYELGVVKVLPLSFHLAMDYVASIFLAASPFLFGFINETANVWAPHVVVGVGYLVISLLTEKEPSQRTSFA